jgi:hypothetical protein
MLTPKDRDLSVLNPSGSRLRSRLFRIRHSECRRWVGNDENQTPDETLSHYEEDCMIPLERYIMYNNLRVKSFPTQKYGAGALSAGRVIDILPSYGKAHRRLNANSQTTQTPRLTPFQIPNFITEEKANR